MEADGLPRHPSLRADRMLRPGDGLRLAATDGTRCRSTSAPAQWRGRACATRRSKALMVADPETMAPVPARRRDDRRNHAARQHRHEGLSEEPGRDRGGVRRRLVPHRRPRGHAPRRLCRDQGPLEGHHHLRRREHLVDRGRGRALPAPRRCMEAAVVARPTRNGARRRAPSSR